MNKNQDAQWSRRSLVNILVLVIFVSLMAVAIRYFYKNQPNVRLSTLQTLAQQFSASVTNAHWQWQAEGRPELIVLVHYQPGLDEDQQLVEKDRSPIVMSSNGWPKVEATSDSCGTLWNRVLNIPLEVQGFRVYAEYYASTQDSRMPTCRYRLSTGPYFEYNTVNGQVSSVQS